MPNRILLAAARKEGLQRFITSHGFTKDVAYRFVAGDALEDAIRVAGQLGTQGLSTVLDYLGENVTSEEQANVATDAYIACLDAASLSGHQIHVSVKLTQLGMDVSLDACLLRMHKLCSKAEEIGTRVAIDMESHEYTDRTIEAYRQLKPVHGDLVLCLQAYLERTPDDIRGLLPLSPAIRLCKGAYNEPRTIAHGRKRTRDAYLACLRILLAETGYTAVATHDDLLIEATSRIASDVGAHPDAWEFQMLYGVRRQLQDRLVAAGDRVRVYVPYGDQWYPYLMRRLAERPANLRFFLESLVRG